MAIDFKEIMNMPNEQVGEIVKNDTNMVMYLGLTTQVKELKNELEKVKANQNILITKSDRHENSINNLEESQKETDAKLNIFKFDATGKFDLYKSTASARVHKLVGKKGSTEYILFYHSFIRKLYRDIYKYLGANNSESISLDKADTAIGMANAWKPNKKNVKDKINEYQRMGSKLKEPRATALEEYLEKTNGGTKIEF